jgi:hypothetical protein
MFSAESQAIAKTPQDLGMYLAMHAAQKGVPYVAICSDANHHDHAQTYALNDLILRQKHHLEGSASEPMKIGEKTLLFNILGPAYKTPDGRIVTEEVGDLEGLERVKNWMYCLEAMENHDGLQGLQENLIPERPESVGVVDWFKYPETGRP